MFLQKLRMYRDACNDPDNRFLRESIVFEVFDTLAQVSQEAEGKPASLDQRSEFYRALEIVSCIDPDLRIAQAWETAQNNPANPNLKYNPDRRATFLNFLAVALDTRVFSINELTEVITQYKDIDFLPETIQHKPLAQAVIRFWGAVARQKSLASTTEGYSLDTAIRSITLVAQKSGQVIFGIRTLAEIDWESLRRVTNHRISHAYSNILYFIQSALESDFSKFDTEVYEDLTYLVESFAEGDPVVASLLLDNTLNLLIRADGLDQRNLGTENPLFKAMDHFGRVNLEYVSKVLEKATDEQKDTLFSRTLSRFLTLQTKMLESVSDYKFSTQLIGNLTGSLKEVFSHTPRREILATLNNLRNTLPQNERLAFDFFSFISQGINGDLLLAREPLEDNENIRLWQLMVLYLNRVHRETARDNVIALYQRHSQADERFYRNFREDVGSEGRYNETTLDSAARIYIGLVMGTEMNMTERWQWEIDLAEIIRKNPMLILARRQNLDLSILPFEAKFEAEDKFKKQAQERFDGDHQKKRSAEQILADLARMPVDDQVRMYEQLLGSEDLIAVGLKALLSKDSLLLRSSHTDSLLEAIGTSGLAALSIDARKLLEERIHENAEKYIDLVEMATDSSESEVIVWTVGLLSELDGRAIKRLDIYDEANDLVELMIQISAGAGISAAEKQIFAEKLVEQKWVSQENRKALQRFLKQD